MTVGRVHGDSSRRCCSPPRRCATLVTALGPLQQGIAAGASVFEVLDEPTEQFGGGREARAAARCDRLPRRELRVHEREGRGAARRRISTSPPARTSPSSGDRAAASPRSSVWCRASTIRHRAACCVDGVDVRECNLRDLRDNVALVSQDVVLFNDSIRNNIAFGVDERRSREAVEEAARIAYVRRVRAASCRRGSIRRSAIAARCCRAASASASPSRARCSRTRRS